MEYNYTPLERKKISTTRKEYIDSCSLLSNSLGYAFVVLDELNQILFVNEEFSRLLKLDKPLKVGENFIKKILGVFKESGIDELIKIHKEIIDTNQRRIYLEVRKNENIVDAYIVHKTPVFDLENNFLCLHIQYKPFTVARLANLGAKFHKLEGYYPLNRNDFAQATITRVQQMIIYLYVRNYSYTEIADWMTRFGHKISPTAVNKQLLKLKGIFNVTTSDALKDVSFKYGYDVAVPAEFLPEGSHDITHDVFDLWIC